jgi:hypothetical protein
MGLIKEIRTAAFDVKVFKPTIHSKLFEDDHGKRVSHRSETKEKDELLVRGMLSVSSDDLSTDRS